MLDRILVCIDFEPSKYKASFFDGDFNFSPPDIVELACVAFPENLLDASRLHRRLPNVHVWL